MSIGQQRQQDKHQQQQQQQQDNEFAQLFELQYLHLTQQITKQLHERNLTQVGLSKVYIKFCKQSKSDQDFQNKIFTQYPNTIVSKHFLSSLYNIIKQQLPRKINKSEKQIIMDDEKSKLSKQINQNDQKIQNSSMKQQQQQEQFEADQLSQNRFKNDKKLYKYMSFPGLAIQNNDQIDLDLDIQQNVLKQQNIPVKIIQNKNKNKQESNYQKDSNKQKHKNNKQKQNQKQQYYRRNYSSDQQKKKDKKHKQQKKHKKQKKHHKYSDSQSDRQYRQKKQKHKHKQKQKQREKQRQKQRQRQRQRSRQHKRYDQKDKQQKIKQVQSKKQVKQGSIYRGLIKKVDKFGCIVTLQNVLLNQFATLHAKQIKQGFQGDPHQLIKQNQYVYAKVIGIIDGRVRVSMKDINQFNGKDLKQKVQEKQGKQIAKRQKKLFYVGDSIGQLTGIKIAPEDQVNQQAEGNNYGELWQLSRLGYMGKVAKSKPNAQQQIQQVNIQVNDRQPPFLKGQTTKAGINLSPVRVVKNPQGTLQRQAQNAIKYAKQRRQIRQKTKNQSRGQLNKVLDEVIPDNTISKKITKRAKLSIKQQRQSLPIFQYRDLLIKACMDNRILIVIGQTGSGKTTQITQYLHQAGLSKRGKIGCTQPRRVAAMSVAKRVCEQMDVVLGEQVGYSIRFQDYTSNKTLIKYMTDGMLLRQALLDKYLSQYSVIMLDEAHERTIHTDVLFGILKKVAQKRKDFTLIVTSATLQAKKFSSYFYDCKIFSIPGRTYNVQILYSKQPQTDYLDAALMCVLQIHIDQPPGDILLFLTGQQQIDTACQVLNQRMKKLGTEVPELIVLPVYSALPSQLQSKIFDPAPRGKRKCVIATNIAEASLTIDGIYYVVDPGFSKVKIFNSKVGMDTLVVAPISQASAKQRAGRAGRTGPGKCYRLYTEQAYQNQMLPTSIPQIQRANLSNTVLQLKAMGINDLINFDFMDAPPIQTLIAALQQLYYLSALDQQGLLTKLGRKMAQFPLQPPLSKMLLTSIDFGCTEQIATIISLLSVQNIFYRPKQKQVLADQKKTKFHSSEGDHLTYLAIYEAWKKAGFSQSWCHENYIQQRSLKRAQDVKKQILDLLQRYKFKIQSCNGNTSLIRKTIVSGFFFHAAKKDSKGGYRTLVDDHQVYIHPSSSLFNKQPEWVIYHELIFTSKQYMRDVCSINPKWLIDVAPNFFKFTDQKGFSRKKRNQKLDPLIQKYGDANAWRLSKRRG